MRRRWPVVLALAGAFLSVGADPALAASPSEITVGPEGPSAAWDGKSFVVAAVAGPDLCPPTIDLGNALCDHLSLQSAVGPGYWETHSGGVTVSIRWADAADNFDLFVLGPSGSMVAASAATGTTRESVFLPTASGTFEVRVVPVSATDAGYTGEAAFSSEELPEPEPPPTEGLPGGGGSAGGGSGAESPGAGAGVSVGRQGGGGVAGSLPGTGSSNGSIRAVGPPAAFDTSETSSRTFYTSAYGGPVRGGVPVGVAERAAMAPVASTLSRAPAVVWLLLPLALVLLAAVAYVVLEPEGSGEGPPVAGERRLDVPFPTVPSPGRSRVRPEA